MAKQRSVQGRLVRVAVVGILTGVTITNIVSFNAGVEIGQVLARTAVLIAIGYWRLTADSCAIPLQPTPR